MQFSSLRGQVLTVRVGDGPKYQFILDVALPGAAMLRAVDIEARHFGQDLKTGTRLTLGAPWNDGYASGEVIADGWSVAQKQLTVKHFGTLEFIQRREVYRVPVKVPIDLVVDRAGAALTARGDSLNVSTSGFAVMIKAVFEAGEQAVAHLELAGRSVFALVTVVDGGEPSRLPCRCHIESLTPADFSGLSAFLRKAEVTTTRTKDGR